LWNESSKKPLLKSELLLVPIHSKILNLMPVKAKSFPGIFNIRFSGQVPFRTADEREEVLSLIRCLIKLPNVSIAQSGFHAGTLTLLSGSRSTAHVFKLTPLFRPGHQVKGPPVIVKITSHADGIAEKANYDNFIRPFIPGAFRPELLGFSERDDRFGLCYSFVGNADGTRMDTITDYLHRSDLTNLEYFLSSFSYLVRDTWYSSQLIRKESDIARRYLDQYFCGMSEARKEEAMLSNCAARYFGARQQNGGCSIGNTWFPSPHRVVFEPELKQVYHSCILHGDLNTDNIIASHDQARLALIDFRHTGRGHVYEDMVALEASLRINYPPNATFNEILEIEQQIALGRRQPHNDPYITSIRKIRDTAVGHFGRVEDGTTYHFAVAAIGLRLMQAVDLSNAARARITASTLWAAKILAENRPMETKPA
jgi:hypothetical protein